MPAGDTGGFFIAVLSKVAPIAARDLQGPSLKHRRTGAAEAPAAAAPAGSAPAAAAKPAAVQPQLADAVAGAPSAEAQIPGLASAPAAAPTAQPSGEDADAAIAAIQPPDAAVAAAPVAAASEAAIPVPAEAGATPAAGLQPTDPPAPAPQPAASDVLREAEGGAAAAPATDKPAAGQVLECLNYALNPAAQMVTNLYFFDIPASCQHLLWWCLLDCECTT